MVAISDLPPWAQDAFAVSKVERLNRVQSQLCDCALFSNENLLLCAPTGAGKTNVALLTMLHVRGAGSWCTGGGVVWDKKGGPPVCACRPALGSVPASW